MTDPRAQVPFLSLLPCRGGRRVALKPLDRGVPLGTPPQVVIHLLTTYRFTRSYSCAKRRRFRSSPIGEKMRLVITVRGLPAPQGSKRPFVNKYTGRAMVVEQNKVPVDRWRSDVKSAAVQLVSYMAAPESAGGLALPGPLDGPLSVRMVFSFARPASHYGTGRNAHVRKPSAPTRPVGKAGDLDKLARSTCDAITSAGVWRDDKLVAEFERLAKVWCGEDTESLDVPGAIIVITPIEGR